MNEAEKYFEKMMEGTMNATQIKNFDIFWTRHDLQVEKNRYDFEKNMQKNYFSDRMEERII